MPTIVGMEEKKLLAQNSNRKRNTIGTLFLARTRTPNSDLHYLLFSSLSLAKLRSMFTEGKFLQ